MNLIRVGFVALLSLVAAAACTPGAPPRASDIQNLNGIADDISSLRYFQSDSMHAADPNTRSTYPKNYETTPTF